MAHGSTQAVYWAMACYELGRFRDAWRLAEECRETSASDDVANQFFWRGIEAKLLAREGRLREAEAMIIDAVDRGAANRRARAPRARLFRQ